MFIESPALSELPVMNDCVGRPDPVELGKVLRRLGKNTGRVHAAAGGDHFHRIDIGLEYADIALGQAWGCATPLLQLLLAGGGPRFNQEIVDTQLLDKAQRFLPRAGADRQHADYGTNAEDDAERGEDGPRFLGPEICGRECQV